MLQDLRYAIRMMRRAPMFSSAVILTSALAIAANTTIFTVVNAVLVHPLPFRDPDRLVQVAEKNDKLNLPTFSASVLNFVSWRERAASFEALGLVGFSNYTLTSSGEPEQFAGNRITPALTRVLGLEPVIGRAFSNEEEQPGAPAVAMLGEGLWRRRFGSERSVIGRTIILNGVPTTVVGVAPSALNLISGGEIYTPQTIDPVRELRLNHTSVVFGRLRPGVSLQRAQAEMNAIVADVGRQYPEVRDWGIHLITLFDTFVSAQLKTGILVLFWAVGFVLLIASANVANLLLARSTTRQNELAMRTALGAERSRLLRQLLVESVALSAVGGSLGLAAAIAAVRVMNQILPPGTLPVSVHVDGTVLLFAVALTVATGVLFGIAPAWRMTRVDINELLKQAGRGSSGSLGLRLRHVLAGCEIALATVLLVGAGLLTQTLANLQRVHLGFDPHGIITFQLAPPGAQYPNARAALLYRDLLEALQALPGVSGAAVSSGIPFGQGTYSTHPMVAVGTSVLPPETLVPIDWRIVSPGYFKTLQIPLVRGRTFTDADGSGATPPALIVSQATAKKFWGDADPIGRALTRSADRSVTFTVVGVVGDVRSTALNQESPALYYPVAWRVWPLMDVVVRTSGSPEALLPSIRQKVRELDAQLALANIRTLDEWVANSAAQPRLDSVLLAVFAGVALVIAAIGIYGVLAYSVSQRTREIGLRIAVGARPASVVRLVVAEGMTVAAVGICTGLFVASATGRALASLLYGVQPRDPATFGFIAAALTFVAVAACAIPARRAARVDPMVALRHE